MPTASVRWARLLTATLALLCLLPFVALSYYNHPFMDDYFNAANVRRLGLGAAQADLYQHWTGRYTSSLVVTLLNPMSYNWYAGFRVLSALVLGGTVAVFYLGVRTLTTRQLSRTGSLSAAIILALFYLHLIPEPYSAIYWLTGAAVYQLGGLLVWLVLIGGVRGLQSPSATGRWRWLLLAALSAVAAAGTNEMALLHLLLGLGLLLAVSIQRRQQPAARVWAGLLLLTVAGGAVALLAPGNYARLGGGHVPWATRLLAAGAGTVTQTGWYFTQPKFWFKVLQLALLGLLVAREWQRRGWWLPALRLPWYGAPLLGLVLLGGSSFLFQLTIGELPPTRAQNGLWLVVVPAALLAGAAALPRAGRPLPLVVSTWGVPAFVLLFGLAGIPKRAWQELCYSASAYDQQLLAREQILRASQAAGHRELVLPPILNVRPYHVLISGWDLTPDPTHYVNSETAEYFGLQTLRIDEQLWPLAHPDFRTMR